MNERLYEKLKQVARARRLVTYAEIVPLVGLGITNPRDPRLSKILHQICTCEVGQGRPMLGAVVVRKADSHPGEGFFNGARALGLLRESDKLSFWINELDRVYNYWSTH